ncbi:Serine/threonine protein kinase [Singulisphaera sp. GP187]|uniref:serine/threonine-protein kinase n=1 Tax=Singulisphaera sp. GP187 TaxID=1882752 RepID=UPI00092884A4|nr:serine/threonine-protein kinase [Singulisphaera sp. GP187]SIO28023.1 Serine/threonine protein kinase [Singulisphaera sp. GP187]
MPAENTCRRCGAKQPADGPAGLCPGCLLRLSLDAVPPARPRVAAGRRSVRRAGVLVAELEGTAGRSRASGILIDLDQVIGPVPRVLLRDGPVDASRLVRPGSEERPALADAPGRYQLFGEIARGGMGVVLMGRDVDLGRDLAIKVLQEEHLDDPEVVRRFVEEAQIGGQLQHPGIVPVHELGRLPDRRLYIAMKLVRGRTLAALLEARQGPADDRPRFLSIFEQVCQAMGYAHTRGVIHRDLKPSNVMVGSFGEVQVMDWGLAKVLDQGGVADEARSLRSRLDPEAVLTVRTGSEAGESRDGSVLGTPAYMAPEQARGALDTLDERADVFGLGSILCEILTGHPAYTGRTDDALYGKASRADLADARTRLDACDADGELVALARSCLAAAPKDRPRDAGMLLAGLTAYLAGVQRRLREAELAQAQAEARAAEEQGRRLLADELARAARDRAAEERKRRILTAALAASVLATALIVGGGWAWLARDRVANALRTAASVDKALAEAGLRLDQARLAPAYDRAKWVEATEAARRAELLLARGEGGPDLRRHVRDLLAAIAGEHVEAEAAEKDRRMVDRLARIHADMTFHLDRAREDAQYAAAFRDYGIDVDTLSPAVAGARIAARPIAIELAGALDHWAFSRRRTSPPRLAAARHLADVARAADPDPWRDRLRDAIEVRKTDRERGRAALKGLAASADVDALTAASVERLAWALADLGDREPAIALYRAAQRAHPDDFWISSNLAQELVRAGRFDEAVRFASAAVAIRPRSGHALVALGKALHLGGRLEDAAATLRKAVRLRPDDANVQGTLDAVLRDLGRSEGAGGGALGAERPDPRRPATLQD